MGDWLNETVLADESTVEPPTIHPKYVKRKRQTHYLRRKERFVKPKFDGSIKCILCEYGPTGDDEMDDNDDLIKFDEIYRSQLGNIEINHLYRQMSTFWNSYIATPSDDLIVPENEKIPCIKTSHIQYHYETCCRGRNISHMLMKQMEDILTAQKNIRDNGMYVVSITDDCTGLQRPQPVPAPENPDDTHYIEGKKKKPLYNNKDGKGKQWIELNKALNTTVKTFMDFQNFDSHPKKEDRKRPRKNPVGTNKKRKLEGFKQY